jgi:hypothetical protein
MLLDNVVTRQGSEQEGPEDPAYEIADPVPAEEEVCVHDENLAWTLSGQSGKRLVKVWTETGYSGSSKVYTTGTLAGNDNNNDGCTDGDDFKKSSFGAFNNDIESAKGYNNCSYMFIFDHKNFKGNWWGRALDDGDLGAAKNENGSIAVDRAP